MLFELMCMELNVVFGDERDEKPCVQYEGCSGLEMVRRLPRALVASILPRTWYW